MRRTDRCARLADRCTSTSRPTRRSSRGCPTAAASAAALPAGWSTSPAAAASRRSSPTTCCRRRSMRSDRRSSALAGAPLGDLLEEAHGEEVPQPIDARIVRSMAVLLVEPAQAAVLVPAELVVATLVARVVDGGGHARGALRAEEEVVVVCRSLRRKLLHHDVSLQLCGSGV